MQINMLKHEIPRELLDNLPEGLKIVSRKGVVFIVVDDCRCPSGHSLLTDKVRLHGEPAIHMKVRGGGVEGNMYLDPFWGLHMKLFDFMFKDTFTVPVIEAFCPHCGISLIIDRHCDIPGCGAEKFIDLALPKGNRIQVCAKWNCPQHDIKIDSLSGDASRAVKSINYPDMHIHSEAIGF